MVDKKDDAKERWQFAHALPPSELQNRTQIFSIAYIGVKMCSKMTYISLVPSVNPA